MELVHKIKKGRPIFNKSNILKKSFTRNFDKFFINYCRNKVERKCTAVCTFCGSSVASLVGNNSNFKRHIKRRHTKIWEEFENATDLNPKTLPLIPQTREEGDLKIRESYSLACENLPITSSTDRNIDFYDNASLITYSNFVVSPLIPPTISPEGFEYNPKDYTPGIYVYNSEWESLPMYNGWLKQSPHSKNAAFCTQCNIEFSIAKRGIEEVERHLLEKHIDRVPEEIAAPSAAKRWCESPQQSSSDMNQSLVLVQRGEDRPPENPDPDDHDATPRPRRQFPSVVTINVGGQIYKTRLATLTKYPNSMLGAMFSGRHTIDKDEDGLYFLDSDGSLFGYILDYLRREKLPPSDKVVDIYKEAIYFGLDSLVQRLSLNPLVCRILVRENVRLQFPNYEEVKMNLIKIATSNSTVNRTSEVYIHAFKSIAQPKIEDYDQNHECVASKADIIFGPWDSPSDEDAFIACLENDLKEEGFNLTHKDNKKRCRYFHGQFACPKILFGFSFTFP